VNREGAFAETLTLPVSNLHKVNDGVSNEEAVFAEPLAAALEVSQQINLTSHERVAVLGDGKLGSLVALGLCVSNPDLTVIGKHQDHLELLEDKKIKTVLLDQVPWSSLGAGFDVVVEATGTPDGIGIALDLVRPEGIVVVKTTSRHPSKIDLARVVVDEIQIIGSRCGDLTLALSYLEKQLVDVKPLIESIYSFSEFDKALRQAKAPGSKKVLVRF
jgi:threonine dehydrogenase-like Zn-dependent dehydrogenase